jgi:hypothetical protein
MIQHRDFGTSSSFRPSSTLILAFLLRHIAAAQCLRMFGTLRKDAPVHQKLAKRLYGL